MAVRHNWLLLRVAVLASALGGCEREPGFSKAPPAARPARSESAPVAAPPHVATLAELPVLKGPLSIHAQWMFADAPPWQCFPVTPSADSDSASSALPQLRATRRRCRGMDTAGIYVVFLGPGDTVLYATSQGNQLSDAARRRFDSLAAVVERRLGRAPRRCQAERPDGWGATERREYAEWTVDGGGWVNLMLVFAQTTGVAITSSTGRSPCTRAAPA